MQPQQRLRSSADFQRVRERAPRGLATPFFMLSSAPNGLDHSRFGFTVSKRVARSAVQRNRVRRRLREAIRLRAAHLRPGYDVVLVARAAVLQASWTELCDALDSTLARARLWQPAPIAGPAPRLA